MRSLAVVLVLASTGLAFPTRQSPNSSEPQAGKGLLPSATTKAWLDRVSADLELAEYAFTHKPRRAPGVHRIG